MLDEYIQEQITRLSEEKKYLSEKLNKLVEQEQEEQKQIAQVLDTEDVGVELFSPRAVNNGASRQISRIKQHVEDLRVQQTEIRQRLEQTIENEKKYRLMYEESQESYRQNAEDLLAGADNALDKEEQQKKSVSEQDETIKQLREQIEELQKEKQDTAEQIQVLQKEKEQLRLQLREYQFSAQKNQNKMQDEKDCMQQRTVQLQEIQQRIEKAFQASQIDRIKCKDELKKLRKYMNELLNA